MRGRSFCATLILTVGIFQNASWTQGFSWGGGWVSRAQCRTSMPSSRGGGKEEGGSNVAIRPAGGRGVGVVQHASRRGFVAEWTKGAAVVAAAVVVSAPKKVVAGDLSASTTLKGKSYQDLIATLLLAKEILIPSMEYFSVAQYDPARTNVNYVTKQLLIVKVLQETLKRSYDECEDADLLDKALESVGVADTTFSNYDSSIYTMIFIPPSDDGDLPKGSDKYIQQSKYYYDASMGVIADVLALAPKDVVKEAEAEAASRKKQLPPFLFKTFKPGQIARPPTP